MRGLRWVAAGRGASEVFAFAAAVTLARLIPPAEFGRAAVPLALIPLAVIMTFEGCASALVQRQTITAADRRSAVLLSLLGGVVLSGLVYLFARTGAAPLFGRRSAQLLALASPVFVVASIGTVPRATLWRTLDFRRVTIVEVISLATGAITSVALAFAGFDAEALIVGALAGTAASSGLLTIAAPFPIGRPSMESIRNIAGFGVPAALAGLIGVAVTSASYVILAARAGPTQTGLYWRAFQLGVSYQEKVSGIMLRVAFPVYSRTKDPAELRRVHERASRLHATVILPLLTLLIALAPLLIPWLIGSAWRGAIRPTQVLAIAGMASALLTGYPQVMLGVGRPKALLRFNVVMLALYIGVVTVTAGYGLMTVCAGVVAVQLIQLCAVYRFLLQTVSRCPGAEAVHRCSSGGRGQPCSPRRRRGRSARSRLGRLSGSCDARPHHGGRRDCLYRRRSRALPRGLGGCRPARGRHRREANQASTAGRPGDHVDIDVGTLICGIT